MIWCIDLLNDGSGQPFTLDEYAKKLTEVPIHEWVEIAGPHEPFGHPLAPAMIALARQRGYSVRLRTNCMGLSSDGVVTLRNHKPNETLVHVPDTAVFTVKEYDWISAHVRFKSTGIKAKYFTLGMLSRTVAEYLAGTGVFVDRRTA